MEPLSALGIAALWGLYGLCYFPTTGKAAGKTTLLQTRTAAA
jgi:hypothetical protein